MIETVTKIICDTCGKQEDEYEMKEDYNLSCYRPWVPYDTNSGSETPMKWYTLTSMEIKHRVKNNGKDVGSNNQFSCGDPHFCSKKCLMKWITNKIDGI